jgi:hypothetical protein
MSELSADHAIADRLLEGLGNFCSVNIAEYEPTSHHDGKYCHGKIFHSPSPNRMEMASSISIIG